MIIIDANKNELYVIVILGLLVCFIKIDAGNIRENKFLFPVFESNISVILRHD
jgi:hypothetical protein